MTDDHLVALVIEYAVGTPVEARILHRGESASFYDESVGVEVLPYGEAMERVHEVALEELDHERWRERHEAELAAQREAREPGESAAGGGGGGGGVIVDVNEDLVDGVLDGSVGRAGGHGGSDE